jgi:hypothetical protein
MAAATSMTNADTAKFTVTGIAVMVAWGESFQVFGALNSSPWTAENFGADAAKAESMRRYVRMAVVNNVLMGGLGGFLTHSWLPFMVTVGVSFWMAYLYAMALKRGNANKSYGWENEKS